MNMFKKTGGFTLVELIVVIAILAILAGIAIPAYSGYISKAEEAADTTTLSAIKTAAQAAMATDGAVTAIKVITNEDKSGAVTEIWVNVDNNVDANKKLVYIPLCGAVKADSNDSTKWVTDAGKFNWLNSDFKMFMNETTPNALKVAIYGTEWHASNHTSDANIAETYTEGWTHALETAPLSTPATSAS